MKISHKQISLMMHFLTALSSSREMMLSEKGWNDLRELLCNITNQQSSELKEIGEE